MKRVILAVLCLLLLSHGVFAELTLDFSAMTEEELDYVIAGASAERAARSNQIEWQPVSGAIHDDERVKVSFSRVACVTLDEANELCKEHTGDNYWTDSETGNLFMAIEFIVENRQEISIDKCSATPCINGWSMGKCNSPIKGGGEIPPHTKAKTIIFVEMDDCEATTFADVQSFGARLHLYNYKAAYLFDTDFVQAERRPDGSWQIT